MAYVAVEDNVKLYYQLHRAPGLADSVTSHPPVLLIHGFASNLKVNWRSTGWLEHLLDNGRDVVALDIRGHGQSTKLYHPLSYLSLRMVGDIQALADHLRLEKFDVIGYSMGARLAVFLAITNPTIIRKAVIAGMGINLVKGTGHGEAIAKALEAECIDDITDDVPRLFRRFSEKTQSDLKAMAACIRAPKTPISVQMLTVISAPMLIVAGSKDDTAGDVNALSTLISGSQALVLPERDHMNAVSDRKFKREVLRFLGS